MLWVQCKMAAIGPLKYLDGFFFLPSKWHALWILLSILWASSRRPIITLFICVSYGGSLSDHSTQRGERHASWHLYSTICPPVSHVFIADDIMLFCTANPSEVQSLRNCMHLFASWSGQMINLNKSFIHLSHNPPQDKREHISSMLRLQLAREDGEYLGLPLVVPRSRTQACKVIQDKLDCRLAGWKAHSLSQARRTRLIQSVALGFPSY